jgi:CheY-like chemotaxis protein
MASRILLADDSITIQKVVNLTFADEGIEVVAVSNGDLAEKRLAEVNPDLVLADIFMPGKNGYELCEAIKESSQFSNVPVVLLVGAFEPFDQTEASRVRADAHLTKPFESRTLVETVRSLISANWQAANTTRTRMPATDDSRDETAYPGSAGTTASALPSHLAGKLDLSAMEVTSDSTSTAEVRNTGELGSPSPFQPRDVFDRSFVDAPAPNDLPPILNDTIDRFEPLEFSAAEVTPPFDPGTRDLHLKEHVAFFDEPNPLEETDFDESTPTETAPMSALHEVNISGAGEGEQWFDSGFETSRLDQTSSDGGWRSPATGSPLSYPSPNFELHSETSYSAPDGDADTACATLLAVDEPLGDVLFEEGVSVDALAPLEMSSSDSLGLEFGEVEVAESKPASSTQFDLVEVAEAQPVVDENTDEIADAPAEVVEQAPVHFEQVTPDEPWAPENFSESSAPAQAEDTQAVSDSDWTTLHAASYSTAQLDSVVMPLETEYAGENSGSQGAQRIESSAEASFTAPGSWTEEEARFTPIDIEAVAVDDASLGEIGTLAPPSSPDLVAEKEPAASVETVPQSPEGNSTQPPVGSLSPAAIDEIVRRVVAQMSESVVREVAWEVVPDCVERVIDQITRESLSKRA